MTFIPDYLPANTNQWLSFPFKEIIYIYTPKKSMAPLKIPKKNWVEITPTVWVKCQHFQQQNPWQVAPWSWILALEGATCSRYVGRSASLEENLPGRSGGWFVCVSFKWAPTLGSSQPRILSKVAVGGDDVFLILNSYYSFEKCAVFVFGADLLWLYNGDDTRILPPQILFTLKARHIWCPRSPSKRCLTLKTRS